MVGLSFGQKGDEGAMGDLLHGGRGMGLTGLGEVAFFYAACAVAAGDEVVEEVVGDIGDGEVGVEAAADVVGDAQADAYDDDEDAGDDEVELHEVFASGPFAAYLEEEHDLEDEIEGGGEHVERHEDEVAQMQGLGVALDEGLMDCLGTFDELGDAEREGGDEPQGDDYVDEDVETLAGGFATAVLVESDEGYGAYQGADEGDEGQEVLVWDEDGEEVECRHEDGGHEVELLPGVVVHGVYAFSVFHKLHY